MVKEIVLDAGFSAKNGALYIFEWIQNEYLLPKVPSYVIINNFVNNTSELLTIVISFVNCLLNWVSSLIKVFFLLIRSIWPMAQPWIQRLVDSYSEIPFNHKLCLWSVIVLTFILVQIYRSGVIGRFIGRIFYFIKKILPRVIAVSSIPIVFYFFRYNETFQKLVNISLLLLPGVLPYYRLYRFEKILPGLQIDYDEKKKQRRRARRQNDTSSFLGVSASRFTSLISGITRKLIPIASARPSSSATKNIPAIKDISTDEKNKNTSTAMHSLTNNPQNDGVNHSSMQLLADKDEISSNKSLSERTSASSKPCIKKFSANVLRYAHFKADIDHAARLWVLLAIISNLIPEGIIQSCIFSFIFIGELFSFGQLNDDLHAFLIRVVDKHFFRIGGASAASKHIPPHHVFALNSHYNDKGSEEDEEEEDTVQTDFNYYYAVSDTQFQANDLSSDEDDFDYSTESANNSGNEDDHEIYDEEFTSSELLSKELPLLDEDENGDGHQVNNGSSWQNNHLSFRGRSNDFDSRVKSSRRQRNRSRSAPVSSLTRFSQFKKFLIGSALKLSRPQRFLQPSYLLNILFETGRESIELIILHGCLTVPFLFAPNALTKLAMTLLGVIYPCYAVSVSILKGHEGRVRDWLGYFILHSILLFVFSVWDRSLFAYFPFRVQIQLLTVSFIRLIGLGRCRMLANYLVSYSALSSGISFVFGVFRLVSDIKSDLTTSNTNNNTNNTSDSPQNNYSANVTTSILDDETNKSDSETDFKVCDKSSEPQLHHEHNQFISNNESMNVNENRSSFDAISSNIPVPAPKTRSRRKANTSSSNGNDIHRNSSNNNRNNSNMNEAITSSVNLSSGSTSLDLRNRRQQSMKSANRPTAPSGVYGIMSSSIDADDGSDDCIPESQLETLPRMAGDAPLVIRATPMSGPAENSLMNNNLMSSSSLRIVMQTSEGGETSVACPTDLHSRAIFLSSVSAEPSSDLVDKHPSSSSLTNVNTATTTTTTMPHLLSVSEARAQKKTKAVQQSSRGKANNEKTTRPSVRVLQKKQGSDLFSSSESEGDDSESQYNDEDDVNGNNAKVEQDYTTSLSTVNLNMVGGEDGNGKENETTSLLRPSTRKSTVVSLNRQNVAVKMELDTDLHGNNNVAVSNRSKLEEARAKRRALIQGGI